MKANELRVGNWVGTREGYGKVRTIEAIGDGDYEGVVSNDDDSVWVRSPYDGGIAPIPITYEWLSKFGFEDGEKRVSYHKIRVREFSTASQGVFEGEFQITFLDHVPFSLPYRVKYVHQLQNLYFAIAGEELSINL